MPKRPLDVIADITAIDEADLRRRARQNDGHDSGVIVKRHNRRLYRVARAVLLGDDREEDIVQDTHLRTFTHFAGFRGESSLTTWLTRISVNEALATLRRRRATAAATELHYEPRATNQAEVIPFPLAPAKVDPNARSPGARFYCLWSAQLMLCLKTRLHRAWRLMLKALGIEASAIVIHVFPFAGTRCARITSEILDRLNVALRVAS